MNYGFTMSEIAKIAGVNERTLYRIRNKEGADVLLERAYLIGAATAMKILRGRFQ